MYTSYTRFLILKKFHRYITRVTNSNSNYFNYKEVLFVHFFFPAATPNRNNRFVMNREFRTRQNKRRTAARRLRGSKQTSTDMNELRIIIIIIIVIIIIIRQNAFRLASSRAIVWIVYAHGKFKPPQAGVGGGT